MRTRAIPLLLMMSVLGLVVFIVATRRATAHLQTRLAESQSRTAEILAQLSRIQSSSGSVSDAAPPPRPHVSEQKSTGSNPPPRAPGLTDLARNNPQLMNLWIASKRAEGQRLYGRLFARLQLTPAQQEKFKDIFAGEIARDADIASAADIQGLPRNDPVITKLADDSKREEERELTALLGEAGFRAYQDFDRAMPVYGFVDGFAVQVAASEPLTPDQAEALRQSLVNASPGYLKGERANPATIDWASVDQTAQAVLSPTQFAAWKLGVAANPFGGSRLYLELQKVYEAAKATESKPTADVP